MYKVPANTVFMGKNLVFMPESLSTNTIANGLSQKTESVEGTVVITDNQTAGRGQKGSFWLTSPGKNLTLSVILHPFFILPNEQFLLNMAISLGVSDYLSSEIGGEGVRIKWPNDILVGGKKICGILMENQIQGNVLLKAIVGIGLNLNQTAFGELQASSLKLAGNKEFDLNACFSKLMESLEVRYLMLKRGERKKIKSEYLKAMFGIGELRTFKSGNNYFEGVIQGVDEQGCLIVKTDEKQIVFRAKEIQFVF